MLNMTEGECLECADELTRSFVSDFDRNLAAGNAASLNDESRAVYENARRYLEAKEIADNHRQFNRLTERGGAREAATKRAFAEAYRNFKSNSPPVFHKG
jgi:hypothetical protein